MKLHTRTIMQVISGTLTMFFIYRLCSLFFSKFRIYQPILSIVIAIIVDLGLVLLVAFVVCLIGQGYWRLKPYLFSVFGAFLGLVVYAIFITVLGALGLAQS